MERIEPGDKVVIQRTNDRGEVTKTEEGRAVVELETRTGPEHVVTTEMNELKRVREETEPS